MDRFARIKTTLEKYEESSIVELIQKYEDTIKPSVSVCVLGLYSAGKSAFINSLIGEEILPSGSDPTTAKVFRINCSDSYSVSFELDDSFISVCFGDDVSVLGLSDSVMQEELLSKISYNGNPVLGMNRLISMLNQEKLVDGEKHKVGELIDISVPFVRSSLPVGKFDFVIYDTPGSNSDTNKKHLEILESSLDSQTKG